MVKIQSFRYGAVGLALLIAVFVATSVTHAGDRAKAIPAQKHRDRLLLHQWSLWDHPEKLARARQSLRSANPEYDFMWRTFFVLSLVNIALKEKDQTSTHLTVIDRIIASTVAEEKAHGQTHFLLPYAKTKPYLQQPQRSLFIDSEIALMMGARRLLKENPALVKPMQRRIEQIKRQMQSSPMLSAESYPNEVWMFDNTNALVALRMAEVLDGQDHGALIEAWIQKAQHHFVDKTTGVLVSSITWEGQFLDGPEGSTIWLCATNLLLLDPKMGRTQYKRAKQELAGSLWGYAFAREWPKSWRGHNDIDSGPIVPVVDASPSSSGFAILAATAFDDQAYLTSLVDALGIANTVLQIDPALATMADNPLGNAVILYGLSSGPLWQAIRDRYSRQRGLNTESH